MKTLYRRIWHCWIHNYHWASAVHGYYPAQWANCSCCGKVLFGPHQIESMDIKPKTINESRAERGLPPIRLA